MTNAIYDFTIGWPVTPHIGVGIGAVDVIDSASVNNFTLRNPIGAPIVPNTPLSVAPQTFGGTVLHGSSWQFGYQAIAGLRYDFSPLVSFDLDYRYLATTGPTITNSARFPFAGGTGGTNCCAGTKTGYNTHNILASVTLKFGAPPAPPPPPAPKMFLVFFDWHKYNITPEGERIIELAAHQYKAGGSVKIQVNGYTDTTGSFAYNQRLSERRANAVASRRCPRCRAQRHGGCRAQLQRSARADASRCARAAEPAHRDRLPAVRGLVLTALGPSHEGPAKTSQIGAAFLVGGSQLPGPATERDRAHVDFVEWVAGDIRYLLPLDL